MLLNVSWLRIVDVVDHPDDLLQQDDDHQPSGSQLLQFFLTLFKTLLNENFSHSISHIETRREFSLNSGNSGSL